MFTENTIWVYSHAPEKSDGPEDPKEQEGFAPEPASM